MPENTWFQFGPSQPSILITRKLLQPGLTSFFWLLIPSDVQSLTQQSDLEAVVKTLAPALLAELTKMKPSSSTSRAKRDSSPETSTHKSKVPADATILFYISNLELLHMK